MEDSDDEIEAFTRKITALRHVSVDLKGVIESQNSRLNGMAPRMSGTFGRLSGMIRRLSKSDKKRFRTWAYYGGATLTLMFLIFIFYIFS